MTPFRFDAGTFQAVLILVGVMLRPIIIKLKFYTLGFPGSEHDTVIKLQMNITQRKLNKII